MSLIMNIIVEDHITWQSVISMDKSLCKDSINISTILEWVVLIPDRVDIKINNND